MAAPLQYLHLVAVRIAREEETCRPARRLELLDVADRVAERFEAPMVPCEILDREGNMTVARAVGVGLLLPLVERELELVAALRITQVEQRESWKVHAVRLGQAKTLRIEGLGPIEVGHPDHRMNELRHGTPLFQPHQ